MTTTLSPRHAVYVGSFDPLTLGHEDIIRRGAQIFEKLTVGIGINPEKKPLFLPEERLTLTRRVVAPLANVDVQCFDALTVDFVKSCGASVMLRGVRTLSDIEAEFTMTLANHVLEPSLETVFLMANEKYTHVSSTLIKQIARMARNGATEKLREFVPEAYVEPLAAKYRVPPADGCSS